MDWFFSWHDAVGSGILARTTSAFKGTTPAALKAAITFWRERTLSYGTLMNEANSFLVMRGFKLSDAKALHL